MPPVGCDVRKLIVDGYPMQNVIASDLRQGGCTLLLDCVRLISIFEEFWNLGHDLFKSSPEKFPVPFIAGDVFDPSHLQSVPPFYEQPISAAPALSSLISLTPLHGHVSIIHASSFFHLFDEEKQLLAAQTLASLMSPLPGSLMLGTHVALPEKGMKTELFGQQSSMFCHSPNNWREMWDGQVFKKGTVNVQANLVRVEHDLPGSSHLMSWSVTRIQVSRLFFTLIHHMYSDTFYNKTCTKQRPQHQSKIWRYIQNDTCAWVKG